MLLTRLVAMRCSAALACWSPARGSWCRSVRPEETGIGAVPHNAACRRTFRRRSDFARPDRLMFDGRLERPWTPQDPGTVRAFQRAGAGGALLLLIAACSGPSSPPPITTSSLNGSSSSTSSAEGGTSVDCNPIDDALPPSDRLVVLGSVALPNPALAAALGTARDPNPTSPVTTFFAKDGLGVTAGTRWRIIVAPESAGHLRIGWGSPAVPGLERGTRQHGCDVPTSTGWLWYPGGYWTDHPACYAVIVEVGTAPPASERRRRCPLPGTATTPRCFGPLSARHPRTLARQGAQARIAVEDGRDPRRARKAESRCGTCVNPTPVDHRGDHQG